MKKIIGILGIGIFTGSMLFTSNTKSDENLAGSIAFNITNAEGHDLPTKCFYTGGIWDECTYPPYIPVPWCENSELNLCGGGDS